MTKADLVIRGGRIFDGRGGTPFHADIAIVRGSITAIGAVSERGRDEIDATGLMVTPGWVDIHTHYDGQMTWAPRMTPSSTLGATTVVAGNCGVGFAPVRAHDRGTLIRLMEGVEDIPGAALNAGLSWKWESFADYMDAVDRLPHDIDVAVQVPHGALRVYVMGEPGANRQPATADENMRMRELTRDAIRAGALGFSTTRTMVHRTADGDFTPTMRAARAEMEAIAAGMADAGAGVLQWVSDFYPDPEEEFQLICDLTRISGRPLSFSMLQADALPNQWREQMERLDRAVADGVPIKAQVAGRPVGLMLGLQGSAHPFISRPSYQAIADLPLAEKVAALRDPTLRARLIAEAPDPAHPFIESLADAHHKMFVIDGAVDYEPDPATSLGAQAKTLGVNPDQLAYDALLADEGKAFLFFPMHNYTEGSLENVRTMLASPNTLSGLSDGGAHVGAICDVSLPTFMLTHWGRDRTHGRFDLSELVRAQTRDTAEAVGLYDRGVIAPGYLADLNIIDFDRLKLGVPYMVYDLPTDARRLMQDAEGYVETIKSEEVIYREGEATGALPGKLIRGGRAAPNAPLAVAA